MLPRLLLRLAPIPFFACAAFADELDDLVRTMRDRVSVELRAIESEQPKNEQEKRQQAQKEHRLMEAMAGLESAIARGQAEEMQSLPHLFAQEAELTPETRRAMEALASKAPELIAKRKTNYCNAVQQLVDATRRKILSAKHADDLSGLLIEIDALKNSRVQSEGQTLKQAAEKLMSAEQTVHNWERYLRQKEAGYLGAAKLALDQILNQRSAYPILRAEEVQVELKRADESRNSMAANATAILRGIRTAADIPAAADRISQLSYTSSEEQSQLSTLKNVMNSFAQFEAALNFGFYDRLANQMQSIGSNSEWGRELPRIEDMLRTELLRKQFSDLRVDPPGAGENHADYFKRLIKTAADKRDWDKLLKLLSAESRTSDRRDPSARATEGVVADFVAGKRLEEAGQSASAIAAYRRVIANSADYAPRDEAAERLKKLADAHPEAAEKATREEEVRQIVKTVLESRPPNDRWNGRPGPY